LREKHKPINRGVAVVVSIITGDDAGLVSAVLTRRAAPSQQEIDLADWYEQMHVGGIVVNIVGRGVKLTLARLHDLAAVLLALRLPWDDGEAVTLPTAERGENAMPQVQQSDGVIDFDNDPVWLAIANEYGGVL